MISISFLITTHNEGKIYLTSLLKKVISHLSSEDEIIILDDYSDDPDTLDIFEKTRTNRPDIQIIQHHLNGDFAEHKNYGKSKCTKQYIFQLDGDETPHDNLILTLKETILFNPTVDLFRVPRINIVTNITEKDVATWRWHVNEQGFINFPDRQDRVFKNVPEIKWINKVHEKIVGHQTHADLPDVEDYCLLHVKSIDRQRAQNSLYETLIK